MRSASRPRLMSSTVEASRSSTTSLIGGGRGGVVGSRREHQYSTVSCRRVFATRRLLECSSCVMCARVVSYYIRSRRYVARVSRCEYYYSRPSRRPSFQFHASHSKLIRHRRSLVLVQRERRPLVWLRNLKPFAQRLPDQPRVALTRHLQRCPQRTLGVIRVTTRRSLP